MGVGVQGQLTLNYLVVDYHGNDVYFTSLAHALFHGIHQFPYLKFWQKELVSKEVKANKAAKIRLAEYL